MEKEKRMQAFNNPHEGIIKQTQQKRQQEIAQN